MWHTVTDEEGKLHDCYQTHQTWRQFSVAIEKQCTPQIPRGKSPFIQVVEVNTTMHLDNFVRLTDFFLSVIKKQRHHFPDKGPYSQSYGFPSNHVWMWELDHREGWKLKNWCFWTVVLEKTLESPLDCKEIQPVHPKGDQPWIFIGRADAEVLMLRSPDVKSWLTGKDSDAGKYWSQEEKRATEDEMVGWHHQLNGHEFEQSPGDTEGQGSLACCCSWGCRVWHDWVTEQQLLNYQWDRQDRYHSLHFPYG